MKCKFCEFVRASLKERLIFLKEVIYGRALVVMGGCTLISMLVYLVTKRADQAGCVLVALALAVAGWNRFNEGFRKSQERLDENTIKSDNVHTNFIKNRLVGKIYRSEGGVSRESSLEELDREMSAKHDGMVNQTQNMFSNKQYHIAEFVLAIVGTLLWGFGASG